MLIGWFLLCLIGFSFHPKGTEAADCPAGQAGTDCTSYVCNKRYEPKSHYGSANYGDLVALATSSNCQKFSFYLDDFMSDIYVWVTYSDTGANPQFDVFGPSGEVIQVCEEASASDKQRLNKYCNADKMQKGLYTIKVKADIEGTCLLRVHGQTNLVVDGGFVSDPHDDHVQYFTKVLANEGITKYPEGGVASYFVFNVNNEVYPTTPLSVNFFRGDNFVSSSNLKARYGCGFPHITEKTFTCTDNELPYYAQINGIDNDGDTWSRIYSFSCESPITIQPTASTTASVITECFNNGTLVNNKCVCTKFFDGENCEWPVCFNGGTVNQATEQCFCDIGFSGDHCQNVRCSTLSNDVFDDNSRAFAIVIRAALSMSQQLPQIIKSTKALLNEYEIEYPNYYSTYVLTIVAQQAVNSSVTYQSADSFLDALNSIELTIDDQVCDDALFAGIQETLDNPSFSKYQNSPVFVFSDGTSSDDLPTQEYVLQQASDTRAQIFFILTDSSSARCNVHISDNQYLSMFSLAGFTQGLLVKSDLSQLDDTYMQIARSLYRSASITSNDLPNCEHLPAVDSFTVDSSVNQFYISATGMNLAITVQLPNKKTQQPQPAYRSGNFYIWSFENPTAGTYSLNMTSNFDDLSECSYRVYTPSSKYSFYFASTDEMNNDRYSREPIVGKDSHVVGKLTNFWLPDFTGVQTKVDLWYNDRDGNRVSLYNSDGLYRDECIYNLYYGSFNCQNNFQYFNMKTTIYDSEGSQIQRSVTGYCTTALPPPPGEQCLNGGVTSNGTCVCPSHFSGSKCQSVLCENQGTQVSGSCVCAPGFSGQFCELVACTTYNEYVHPSDDHRSLTLLLHDSLTTRAALRTINEAAVRVVHDIQLQYSKWFDYYQLMRFNSTDYRLQYDGSDPQSFLQALDSMYEYNLQHSDISCSDLDTYGALSTILEHEHVAWGGIVYVFVYGMTKTNMDYYEKIMTHVERNKIQINVVQLSLMPCGKEYENDGLLSLAQVTGGTYYVSSQMNAGKVFSSLNTNYGSSLVYERQVDACSDAHFFIPIDSATQSFTVYVQGELASPIVYNNPNGDVITDLYVNTIWSDVVTDTQMDQIIKKCDDGWIYSDGHCWKIGYKLDTWQNAKQDCAANGANLATIYNSGEQNFVNKMSKGVSFWIGLNNQQNIDEWDWDVSNNITLTLAETKYTNWGTGQPVKEVTERCVIDYNTNDENGWAVGSCDERHFYFCSKGHYDNEFEPSDTERNQLLNGLWQVTVNATGSCSVSVRAQSNIQLITSFTTDIHSDFGDAEPIAETKNNRIISLVTGITNVKPKSIEYAHVYDENGALVQVETIQMRSDCRFSFISTPFQCIGSTFQMFVSGTDDSGSLFQRIVPVTCSGGVDSHSCENGAVFNDGSCICPPGYTGSNCEMAICENGFPNAELGSCECLDGWTGGFCDTPVCSTSRGGTILTENGKTFVLAVDAVSSGNMVSVLNDFETTLSSVLKKVEFSYPRWFENFVGVVFYDSKSSESGIPSVSSVVRANNYSDFTASMTKLIKSQKYSSESSTRSIYTALNVLLAEKTISPSSPVFVITSSGADDIITSNLLYQTIAAKHPSIFEIFIGDTGAPGGGSYADNGVQELFETAHQTGGAVYQTPAESLEKFWDTQLNTLYGSYYLSTHHISDCINHVEYIQIGVNSSELVVDIYGAEPSIFATDPDGQEHQLITTFTSKTNILAHFADPLTKPGVWAITLNSNNGNQNTCMLNVRSQSNQMNSLLTYASFTQDVGENGVLQDGTSVPYPIASGIKNAVVAAVTSGALLSYAQALDIEDRILLWASPMIPRKNCDFSFITTDSYICDRPTFILAINGFDVAGHPFRRLFTYHCQGPLPQPASVTPSLAPPVTTQQTTTSGIVCHTSQPKADLIIAFDSSNTVPHKTYNKIIALFRGLSDSFIVGQHNVRIDAGTYDALASFDDNSLLSINNTDDYMARLDELKRFGYTGSNGNNINDVLEYVKSLTDQFRAVRKIVIFVSSLGWDKGNTREGVEVGYMDPKDNIAALKENGVEFIPIAWGDSADITQLNAFSDKCLQKANTVDDISSAINFISQSLCSTEPQC
ncbi:unnamed protein product [Auanema sp. JU1783]|nr:unnamed protein product [Auanema sp. JU1783]